MGAGNSGCDIFGKIHNTFDCVGVLPRAIDGICESDYWILYGKEWRVAAEYCRGDKLENAY